MTEHVKVSCLQCGATNNFPVGAEGRTVVCGRCKTPLPVPGRVLAPTPEQIVGLIETAALPILIDFFSQTCMPCHRMRPIVEDLARRRAGTLTVVQVDTDLNRELAAAFKIQAVPTFVVMKKGYEIARTAGAMNETDFSLWVASKT